MPEMDQKSDVKGRPDKIKIRWINPAGIAKAFMKVVQQLTSSSPPSLI